MTLEPWSYGLGAFRIALGALYLSEVLFDGSVFSLIDECFTCVISIFYDVNALCSRIMCFWHLSMLYCCINIHVDVLLSDPMLMSEHNPLLCI